MRICSCVLMFRAGIVVVMPVIALESSKGGTGKTTSTVHLACALATTGAYRQVTVVDADPQHSTADWADAAARAGDPLPFPVVPAATARGLTQSVHGALHATPRHSDDTPDTGADGGNTGKNGDEGPDEQHEQSSQGSQGCQDNRSGDALVLIDTPPGHGELIDAATRVADLVVITSQPSEMDVDRALSTLRVVSATGDTPALLLLTTVGLGERLGVALRSWLTASGSTPLAGTVIPRRTHFREAFGTTPDRLGAYRDLADEVRNLLDA